MSDDAAAEPETDATAQTEAARAPDLPLPAPPPGYTTRRPTIEDLDRVVELYDACDLERIGEIDHDRDELRTRWVDDGRLEDVLLVEFAGEDGPELAGYAEFHEDRDPWMGELDLYLEGRVAPGHMGHGIASFLLARGVRRARVAARDAGESRVVLQTTTANEDARARRFYVANGFTPVRHLLRLRLDLDRLPHPPVAPHGVRLKMLTANDLELAHAVHQQAFADHWDFEASSFEDWRYLEVDRIDGFDPKLWFLAISDEGEPAGLICAHYGLPDDPRQGHIRHLGVVPAFRRRGIAAFLLASMLRAFALRGATSVGLEVDDVTEEGALRLYEKAGMRVVRRMDVYAIRIDA